MATTKSVKVPLARVWSHAAGGTIHRTLAWGDRLEFEKREGKNLIVKTVSFDEQPDGTVTSVAVRGYIRHDGATTASILGPATHKVLKIDFVDVQQGDGMILESPSGQPDVDLIALEDGLDRLAAMDERKSRVVELKFFGGLTTEEIAEVLQISGATVEREWAFARAWLYDAIEGNDAP